MLPGVVDLIAANTDDLAEGSGILIIGDAKGLSGQSITADPTAEVAFENFLAALASNPRLAGRWYVLRMSYDQAQAVLAAQGAASGTEVDLGGHVFIYHPTNFYRLDTAIMPTPSRRSTRSPTRAPAS